MHKYIGQFHGDGTPKQAVIGVPAEDLTEEAWTAAVKAGFIDPDGPTGALWEKAAGAAAATEKPATAGRAAPQRGAGGNE